MREFEQRVVVEGNELKGRLKQLETFLERKDAMRTVGQEELARMHLQRTIMREYADVLDERIRHFQANKVWRHGET